MEAADLLADAANFLPESALRVARPRRPKTGMRRSLGANPRALPESQPIRPARRWECGTRDRQ